MSWASLFTVDRVLFKASNAPFSKEDAQEMTDLIKTIAGEYAACSFPHTTKSSPMCRFETPDTEDLVLCSSYARDM